MKRLSTFLPLTLLAAFGVNAQYCSPTFANGCALWQIKSVSVGSSFIWDYTDCSAWDQTATTILVNSANSISMSVTSGIWCGCSVWVDLDNSGSFEEAENLYHAYVGGDPDYTYTFNIGIPPGTAEGPYRMRVIGGWGTDGFTTGSGNGFGPCGSFQYGNFNDFTLEVSNTVQVAELASASILSARPNPTTGMLTLDLGPNTAKDGIALEGLDGRILREVNTNGAATIKLDLSDLPAGIYFIRNTSDASGRPLRIVKQ